MVADISVSGTKLHVIYSDGTSKNMDMPPATSLRLPYWWRHYSEDSYLPDSLKGYVDITTANVRAGDDYLAGTIHYNGGGTSSWSLNGRW